MSSAAGLDGNVKGTGRIMQGAHEFRHYEELPGQNGRAINFRAERVKARSLFPKLRPILEVDAEALDLENVSLSGMAVLTDRDAEWSKDAGSTVPIRLTLAESVLYDGCGEVRWCEKTPFGTKIGLRFKSGVLDIDALRSTHNDLALRQRLFGDWEENRRLVDPRYRQICADIVETLRTYRAALESFERQSVERPEAMAGFAADCEKRLLAKWRDFWFRSNDLLRPVIDDPRRLAATKEFTERLLTPELMDGPIWRRSYEKPLGYPGDYKIMQYAYDFEPEGDSAYGRLVHRLGLEAAECIATRKNMMTSTIAQMVAESDGSEPVRMVSLGCGPARELSDYLAAGRPPRPLAATLIDQDADALSQAQRDLYPHQLSTGGMVDVRALQASFTQILKPGSIFRDIPPQDLIYSVGLIDYLTDHRAQALVAALFGKLAPGGRLIVGNMRDTRIGNLWPMEFLTDWSLYYRSQAGMLAMAERIEPARKWLEPDPTGRVYMLSLEKAR